MLDAPIQLGSKKKQTFIDKVKEVLPEGGNLNLCLTCGACSSGCPATGLANMDPRKFLRMAALGLDDEIAKSDWPWMCSMCQRCIYVCPMQIDIPQLVYNARQLRPREERPKGILGSCDMALRNESTSAMGRPPMIFNSSWRMYSKSTVRPSRNLQKCKPPSTKKGPSFFSTRTHVNRSPSLTRWFPCGRSCTWPAWIGPMAARDGREKITACSWPMTMPGNTSPPQRPIRRINWGAKRSSTPSEGT